MKKIVSHVKHIGVKSLVIGSCLLFAASGTALGQSMPEPYVTAPSGGGVSPDAFTIQIMDVDSDHALNAKHREVDQYLFEQHQGKFDGFVVTHTGVIDGKVEIGITPYQSSYADGLYEKLGTEINVVEGQQAVTFDTPVQSMVMPAPGMTPPAAPSEGHATITNHNQASTGQEKDAKSADSQVVRDVVGDREPAQMPLVTTVAEENRTISAPMDSSAQQEMQATSAINVDATGNSPSYGIIIAATLAVLLLGAVAWIFTRRKTVK